jgi:hypothetical protein
MNVEIGAEAALFPEKEYINGIAVAVYRRSSLLLGEGREEEAKSYDREIAWSSINHSIFSVQGA